MQESVNNLFWRQEGTPKIREHEKENNVTSAFLILLKYNHTILKKLLNKVKIPQKINNKKKEIIFQLTPRKVKNRIQKCKNKYLLFIHSKQNENVTLDQNKTETGKPDGLIFDGTTAILIEAKVSGSKNEKQLQKYKKQYFDGKAYDVEITWEKIHDILAESGQDLKEINTPDFLHDQFKKYLEVIRLSGFSGIPFFDKEEAYTKKDANEVLKLLRTELKERDWFKKSFVMGKRPISECWESFCHKTIKDKNPRMFPHYSIYIFSEYFALDCLFHKKELKKIVENKGVFDTFAKIIKKLSNNPDYYFRAVDYHLLANKKPAKAQKGTARKGTDYTDFEYFFQLRKFIKHHRNNRTWEADLKANLELLLKEEIKQFGIIKKAHYADKEYEAFTEPDYCLKFIQDTIEETNELFGFIMNQYNEQTRNDTKSIEGTP